MSVSDAVVYRDMRPGDIPTAARLHRLVFADHFLGHMDRRFLALFYAQFLPGKPGVYAVVAVRDGSVVGTVLGSTDLTGLYRRFYRRHFFELGALVARTAVSDAWVRGHLAERLPHVVTAVRSKLRIGHAPPPDASVWPPTQLLSIGVHPRYRGSPVAEQLTREFCDRLSADGVDAVGLSVLKENGRAIRFYDKTGWIRGRSNGQALMFWRPLRGPASIRALRGGQTVETDATERRAAIGRGSATSS